MSSVPALQQAMDILDKDTRVLATSPKLLSKAIRTALQPPPLCGSPHEIRGQASLYETAWRAWVSACEGLDRVVTADLPAAWRGRAAESATSAVQSLKNEAVSANSAFAAASTTLHTWADQLSYALNCDEQGRSQLQAAWEQLRRVQWSVFSPFAASRLTKLSPIVEMAAAACNDRLVAAKSFDAGAAVMVKSLNDMAEQVRGRWITTTAFDPLTRIVLAGAGPDILSSSALTRGSQRFDWVLSTYERTQFQSLLANAKSPLEASELWKALGAGYSLTDIKAFDESIHPHGDDATWLTNHLEPDIGTVYGVDPSTQRWAGYEGVTTLSAGDYPLYSQGSEGDCVAASTVVARANVDPVYMLGLSTGQGPAATAGAKAGEDSPAALKSRLQNAYLSNENSTPMDATSLEGSVFLANHLLATTTGHQYESTELTDAAARSAVMPRIEAAVNAGQPVLVGVYSPKGGPGHQMVVIGAHGDSLEVYNPWGFTQSVTKQQFIDGQLGALTSDGDPNGGLPVPDHVALPK